MKGPEGKAVICRQGSNVVFHLARGANEPEYGVTYQIPTCDLAALREVAELVQETLDGQPCDYCQEAVCFHLIVLVAGQ